MDFIRFNKFETLLEVIFKEGCHVNCEFTNVINPEDEKLKWFYL